MRYTQPKITGKYAALSTIKSEKPPVVEEITTANLSAGASYQADE